MKHNLNLPIKKEDLKTLKLEDIVFLNGTLITARDQAHKRILKLNKNNKLPAELKGLEGSAIYHCGPIIKECENKYILISGGPTTSERMDTIQNEVVDILGIKLIIGKGGMKNLNTKDYRVCYLSLTGGCGAIISKKVKKIRSVLWKDLGLCEAVWFLEVKNFGPLIVTQLNGKSIYEN
ncbi:MAG: fumarate hydratase C-terminal domain-containing protein [Candidatus Lokiarchaeota archaeon]|nr:fumarate hydratase C-terminal domain-containing protein [Candidatus Lokiarchaeota archaeon]